jgi:DNA-binding SARP family transcriptional activator
MREPRWQVRLLGTLEAGNGAQQLLRFPLRAVATLLARLALAPERAHAREELVELLWPGVELAVGRNRLRQALSTLRSLLEPPGEPGAAVLQADRLSVRVVPGAFWAATHGVSSNSCVPAKPAPPRSCIAAS